MNEVGNRPKIVIIGGGFAGLALTQALKNAPVDITLVDKTNHHLFQPLLYQVAVGALSPADIAAPFRSILRKQKNVRILLDEAVKIDKERRRVYLKSKDDLAFEYLALAPGSRPAYFGNDDWPALAPGLKTIADALSVREKILLSYEMAVCSPDPLERKRFLTFVVIGAGPTGVEMAGSLAEIGGQTMRGDYRLTEPIEVYLIEGGPRILASFAPELSARAQRDLEGLGVKVLCNVRVEYMTEGFIQAGAQKLHTANVFWAAGVEAAPVLQTLITPLDRSGRAVVNADLSIPDFANIFVLGDAAAFAAPKGGTLPGVAQVAMQQGVYLANIIRNKIVPESRKPFVYFDKGNMATIGRALAVAETGKIKLGGFIAWAMWAVIHVAYLINFQSRTRVMLAWAWYYLTFRPGARIIYRRATRLK